jgi:Domain of unknown function (DUF4272)
MSKPATDSSSDLAATPCAQWAQIHNIATETVLAAIEDFPETNIPWSGRQIAARAVISAAISAVAQGKSARPIIAWFKQQKIVAEISPLERSFLLDPESIEPNIIPDLLGRNEAAWALLWAIGKVEVLGLPTYRGGNQLQNFLPDCGEDLQDFLNSARLRPLGELLAEEDRHYRLWCQYFQTYNQDTDLLPDDLLYVVLYQREYVFEWFQGVEKWDDIQCDS